MCRAGARLCTGAEADDARVGTFPCLEPRVASRVSCRSWRCSIEEARAEVDNRRDRRPTMRAPDYSALVPLDYTYVLCTHSGCESSS